jgi:LysM repeat protein
MVYNAKQHFTVSNPQRRAIQTCLIVLTALLVWLVGYSMPVAAAPQATAGKVQCAQTHRVQRGENLYRIALRYHTTVRNLQQWNQIANPNRIYAGQQLCVEVRVVAPESPEARPTDVELIQALTDVRIRRGPGMNFAIIGHLPAGKQARVTGISPNGQWWRVLCPDHTVGSCWVTANATLTRPVAPGHNPGHQPDWGTSQAVIESISIQVRESYPVQVVAVVRGYLPDGCSYVDRFRQVREGNTIRLQLTTGRNPGFCTQALVPFEQVIPLDVAHWQSGLYRVVLGPVRTDFYLP